MVTIINNGILQGASGSVFIAPNTTVPDAVLGSLTPWNNSDFPQYTDIVNESPMKDPCHSCESRNPLHSLDSHFRENNRFFSMGSRFLEDARELMEETGFLPQLMGTVKEARHPRESGDPVQLASLDPRFRGNDTHSSPPRISLAVQPASQSFGLTIGFRMSLELRHVLKLSQSLRLSLFQRLGLGTIRDYYSSVFNDARKLHVQIEELGLDFEVALVSRFDLPEATHLGSAGLMSFGHPFVVEDFFADLDDRTRELFIRLVAVHEYGEVIFGDHHLASLLELAVASHMGVLEQYLEFYERRYALKFRDVALHRLKGG